VFLFLFGLLASGFRNGWQVVWLVVASFWGCVVSNSLSLSLSLSLFSAHRGVYGMSWRCI